MDPYEMPIPHEYTTDDSMRVFLDEVRRLDWKATFKNIPGISVSITWSDGTPLFITYSYIRETKENVRELARQLFKRRTSSF